MDMAHSRIGAPVRHPALFLACRYTNCARCFGLFLARMFRGGRAFGALSDSPRHGRVIKIESCPDHFSVFHKKSTTIDRRAGLIKQRPVSESLFQFRKI